ncbi:MAG: glycosyltransferase [Acidobacteria bacterium]|nr:glycosyltransferase [Acidobacteriota bacterium]
MSRVVEAESSELTGQRSDVASTSVDQSGPVLDVSVVVPVRNAERLIEDCLAAVKRSNPREIIVVDGMSTDRTLEIARRFGARILADEGKGLPAARRLGVEAASARWVMLLDADVVMPDGALSALFEEFTEGAYSALQAGLHSVSGPGYWGQALANHHRSGRSQDWFGVVATIFERDTLLRYGFDERFLSGEDIELRWRLQRAGARIGVSRRTIVTHRFDDTFEFARGQWLADGHGTGRMLRKHRWRAGLLSFLPLAAGARGLVLSIGKREPKWIPYYTLFTFFNYIGIVKELANSRRSADRP